MENKYFLILTFLGWDGQCNSQALVVMEVETKCFHAKSDKEDLLHQNNKSIMERVDIFSHFGKEQVHLSFRDKLMGLQANNVEKDTDNWFSDDEADELEEHEDPCCSKLRLSKEEKGRIRKSQR